MNMFSILCDIFNVNSENFVLLTDSVLEMLERGHFMKEVGSHHLFVNIEDAVVHAVNSHRTRVSLPWAQVDKPN